jgi:hypothetical protein
VNRRGRRVREYYGFALIAGISHEDAEDMLIGYVLDMYMMRLRYDAKLAGAKLERNLTG